MKSSKAHQSKKSKFILIYFIIFLSSLSFVFAQAPNLVDIYVAETSNTKVDIIFNTDRPARYSIHYGRNILLDKVVFDNTITPTERIVKLSELYPDTTYFYNITICDEYSYCNTYGPYQFKIDTSPKNCQNCNSETKEWITMQTGINRMYTNDLNINKLELKITQPISHTEVTINKLDKRPDGYNYLKKKAYRYYTIESYNIPKSNILYSNIFFYVSKEWLELNQLSEDKITLYKYTNDWVPLPTKLVTRDSSKFYFQSSVDSLGIFAIGEIDENRIEYKPIPPPPIIQNTTNITIHNKTIINESPTTVPIKNNENQTEESQKSSFNFKKIFNILAYIGVILFVLGVSYSFLQSIHEEHKHYLELLIFRDKHNINALVRKIRENLKNENFNLAKSQYAKLSEIYNQLNKKDKNKHYPKIEKLIEGMNQNNNSNQNNDSKNKPT